MKKIVYRKFNAPFQTDGWSEELRAASAEAGATVPSSFGWVDGDFDKLEATETEYVERLRTRGTF
jgi:hypothetical protein